MSAVINYVPNSTVVRLAAPTSSAAHQTWDLSTDRFIGRNASGNMLDGGLDRALFFDTRLSDAECQAVIAGGNGPSGVLARYELNEISGGRFLDASGNGKHATVIGSPVITDF